MDEDQKVDAHPWPTALHQGGLLLNAIAPCCGKMPAATESDSLFEISCSICRRSVSVRLSPPGDRLREIKRVVVVWNESMGKV